MTKKQISITATEYAKKADPLNQTLEKQADIRMGFLAGFDFAQSQSKLQDLHNQQADACFETLRSVNKNCNCFKYKEALEKIAYMTIRDKADYYKVRSIAMHAMEPPESATEALNDKGL